MSLADLGRRAVACKHWRWMPGMLMSAGMTTFRIRFEGDENVDRCGVPDLTDPATLGCLLHLVRQAWGVERAVVWWNEHDQGWVADVRPRNFVFVRDSEAHALVAALEAAP